MSTDHPLVDGLISGEWLSLGAQALLSGHPSVIDHAHWLVALVPRHSQVVSLRDILFRIIQLLSPSVEKVKLLLVCFFQFERFLSESLIELSIEITSSWWVSNSVNRPNWSSGLDPGLISFNNSLVTWFPVRGRIDIFCNCIPSISQGQGLVSILPSQGSRSLLGSSQGGSVE